MIHTNFIVIRNWLQKAVLTRWLTKTAGFLT